MIKTLDLFDEIGRKFQELEHTSYIIKKFRPNMVCKYTQQDINGTVGTFYLDDVLVHQDNYVQDLKALVLELEDRLSYVENLLGTPARHIQIIQSDDNNIQLYNNLDSSACPLLQNNTYTSISSDR